MDRCRIRHRCGIMCAVLANGECAPPAHAESELRHPTTDILVKGSDSNMAEDQEADTVCAVVEEEAQQGDSAVKGNECGDDTFEAAHGAANCILGHQHLLLLVSQLQRSQGQDHRRITWKNRSSRDRQHASVGRPRRQEQSIHTSAPNQLRHLQPVSSLDREGCDSAISLAHYRLGSQRA